MARPYRWLASRIDTDLMSRLHRISTATRPRVAINELIRRALDQTYGLPVTQFPMAVADGGEREAA